MEKESDSRKDGRRRSSRTLIRTEEGCLKIKFKRLALSIVCSRDKKWNQNFYPFHPKCVIKFTFRMKKKVPTFVTQNEKNRKWIKKIKAVDTFLLETRLDIAGKDGQKDKLTLSHSVGDDGDDGDNADGVNRYLHLQMVQFVSG